MSRLRIILVDDHTLFRKGLAELLESEGAVNVVAITGNPSEVAACSRPSARCADPGPQHRRHRRYPGHAAVAGTVSILPVLILTVSEAEEDMARALRNGAKGYLLKSMEPDEVVDAIIRAARGETVVAPGMTAKLVRMLDNKGSSSASLLESLTQREREILSHLAKGESNKAIARQLDISYDTVKLHVRHILAKLNLSSRVAAAVFAVEHKLGPGAEKS
jgi:two-component system nitrate/nitrite response regulator NarL